MKTNTGNTPSLLVIDVSPRTARSRSRTLSHDFVEKWKTTHAGGRVVVDDLAKNPPPFVSEPWMEGAFSPPEGHSSAAKEAMKTSDKYVDELLAASEVIISTPLFNLTYPAVLKAWIDQIVRAGRTMAERADGTYYGLVPDKNVLVIVASGSDFRPSGPAGAYNYIEPYLRTIFGYIGITKVSFVYAHSLNKTEELRKKSMAEASEALTLAAAN